MRLPHFINRQVAQLKALKTAKDLGAEILINRTDAGDGKSFFATIRDLNGNVIGLWSKK